MVTATRTEFSIELSQQTFPRGTSETVAEGQGEFPHALSIEDQGVNSTSTPVIQPDGGSQILNVDLQPRHP